MDKSVVVIGAGIVGVTTALELGDRGWSVTLVDRKPPGQETSFGNAGVLSASTVLTVNNRSIWRQMPRLLINRSSHLRYDPTFACRQWRWIAGFLRFSLRRDLLHIAKILAELQRRSIKKHRTLMEKARILDLSNQKGLIKLYRTKRSYAASRLERKLMDATRVRYSVMPGEAVTQLEPALGTDYHRGIVVTDSQSIRDPASLTAAYFSLFERAGGTFLRADVTDLCRGKDSSWSVRLGASDPLRADAVVVAAGPWSADVCGVLGYKIPLAWERGYHTHVGAPDSPLRRSVYDAQAGVVMTPQIRGVRVSSGVEIAARDAPPDYRMIRRAVAAARRVAEFGPESDTLPWVGSRPTLPDSLPMIGPATRHEELWFNFGHQHIGLSTSTGSAEILANLMSDKRGAIAGAAPFRPQRFTI